MNDNAKKWVSALRSGEYTQTRSTLKTSNQLNEDKYCCLGVACDLFAKETGLGQWNKVDYNEIRFICNDNGQSARYTLPGIVKDWLGLRTDNGTYTTDNCLTSHNDKGDTFNKIADIIESEPEGLFAE